MSAVSLDFARKQHLSCRWDTAQAVAALKDLYCKSRVWQSCFMHASCEYIYTHSHNESKHSIFKATTVIYHIG
jgi:hypothetical protein